MGQRYAELVKARQLASVFVGPDNKIINPGRTVKRSYSPASSVDSGRITFKSRPPAPNAKFPCTQCDSTYTRMWTAVSHLIKVHDFTEDEAHAEKPEILKKAHKVKKEPRIIISKLSQSQINQWIKRDHEEEDDQEKADENLNYFEDNEESHPEEKSSEFKKLAMNINTNLQVCLPRLSPSKFLPSNTSKRSRSASPSSCSTSTESSNSSESSSSSKEENIFSAPKRPRKSSPQPRRSVLTAKVEQENTTPKKKYHTRRAGPASAIKNRELKQLLMDSKP